ncbi:uncharacterized mitochondrial protein AtMg00810-like [Rhododendron vialii]|uniref:uncharacterized mitochondrial protein AtMg00810-like n=1 Tax=Rhododendron vialii TaxID=182163 RepID=UPI00265D77CB|nr:uncharacterized mitochondrial protein AtMg00810-like [Rhododendron vialii]
MAALCPTISATKRTKLLEFETGTKGMVLCVFFLPFGAWISSKADTSLFLLHKGSSLTLISVYVDDIILTGSDSSYLTHLVHLLSSRFVMKDLGSLHYFLGIEVNSTPNGLFLSQAKYAQEILTKAIMQECKSSASPTSSKGPYDPSDPLFDDVTLVGSLQYLTLIRPESPFFVNTVCQHMHQPKVSHFAAVKRLLQYVKGTLNHEADWTGDLVDRRSTSGFVVFLGSTPISWCAKKQPTVARSSAEAKYRAMAQTATDLHPTQYSMLLTKHIEIDYHFIREQVLAKKLVLCFIGSTAEVAYIFTKGLGVSRFLFLKTHLTPHEFAGEYKGKHSSAQQLEVSLVVCSNSFEIQFDCISFVHSL